MRNQEWASKEERDISLILARADLIAFELEGTGAMRLSLSQPEQWERISEKIGEGIGCAPVNEND